VAAAGLGEATSYRAVTGVLVGVALWITVARESGVVRRTR
jgi:hypothetical protein